MVLETRLIGTYLLILTAFICASCSAGDNEVSDQANIKGYDLVLRASQGLCYLDSKIGGMATSTRLKIDPPCYFLRQGSIQPQSFSYEDAGILSTIIMIGSPITDEKRKKWNIGDNDKCGEGRQAILFKKSGMAVTEKILEGGVICKDKGADEKDFWYFAH